MPFAIKLLALIYTILCFTEASSDPCDASNHKTFPNYDFGSRNEKCDPMQSALCDFYFTSGWYVVDNAKVLNHCPSGYCGTTYPAWMQGTFPDQEDGIVNRTVCIKFHTDCCQENVTMMVKNCSLFYVFYFVQLRTCPMAYCFESDLPCIPPSTTAAPGGSSVSTIQSTATTGILETTSNTVTSGAGNGLPKTDNNSKAILIGVSVGAVGLILGIGFAVLGYLFMKGRLPNKRISDSTVQIANNTYETLKIPQNEHYVHTKLEKN